MRKLYLAFVAVLFAVALTRCGPDLPREDAMATSPLISATPAAAQEVGRTFKPANCDSSAPSAAILSRELRIAGSTQDAVGFYRTLAEQQGWKPSSVPEPGSAAQYERFQDPSDFSFVVYLTSPDSIKISLFEVVARPC